MYTLASTLNKIKGHAIVNHKFTCIFFSFYMLTFILNKFGFQKNEKNGDKSQSSEGDAINKEDLDYLISEEDKKSFNKLSQKSGCISRARTPRDIDLEISNSKSKENKSYSSYL